jgi:glycosyltransferase involved in cell wall biosynthesis
MTVSQNTKDDLTKHFSVKPAKIRVSRLGVDMKPSKTGAEGLTGAMPTKPYLLFIGAGDARRRVDDAVAAFNNLKANGRDIQLVLAGENFQSIETIPNPILRNEVMASSYKNDILTLGYINDETKQTLFKQAIAYVYPTKYEGFGIPILEAMLLECPVVVYKNSSTHEVGGEFAYYAKDWQGIVDRVEELLALGDEARAQRTIAAKQHAEGFTWDKTASVIYEELRAVAQ